MGERERGEEEEQEGRCRGEVEKASTAPFIIPTEEEAGWSLWLPRGAGKKTLPPFGLRARKMTSHDYSIDIISCIFCSDWSRHL